MLKKILLAILLLFSTHLQGEIIEIYEIEDIRSFVTQKDTLVLFDIDNTLITSSMSLGSYAWRTWIKNKLPNHELDFPLYDALVLYIAKNIPWKPVESNTPQLIADLQLNNIPVFAFTARGRKRWYNMNIHGVDYFTHRQLDHIDIHFNQTLIPDELQKLESDYFHEGIIFAGSIQKGNLFKHLFKDLNYHPSLIIFIDDKLELVQSVESAIQEFGIPIIGFWYRRTERDDKSFNPLIANIQLEHLLLKNSIIGNAEAEKCAAKMPIVDQQLYLHEILSQLDLDIFLPVLP